MVIAEKEGPASYDLRAQPSQERESGYRLGKTAQWPDPMCIETYCSLYDSLRAEGTLIPDADLLIAATAISHDIALRTGDEHF
jgi:predicted nucleic acid-binding protein